MKTRSFTPVPAVSLDEQVLDLTFVRNLVRECYVAGMGTAATAGRSGALDDASKHEYSCLNQRRYDAG
jgi:hypothetical protein